MLTPLPPPREPGAPGLFRSRARPGLATLALVVPLAAAGAAAVTQGWAALHAATPPALVATGPGGTPSTAPPGAE